MARAIGSDPGREARFLESTDLMRKSGTSHDDKVKKAKSSHREWTARTVIFCCFLPICPFYFSVNNMFYESRPGLDLSWKGNVFFRKPRIVTIFGLIFLVDLLVKWDTLGAVVCHGGHGHGATGVCNICMHLYKARNLRQHHGFPAWKPWFRFCLSSSICPVNYPNNLHLYIPSMLMLFMYGKSAKCYQIP